MSVPERLTLHRMRDANDDMMAALPEIVRSAKLTAQVTRAKFDALMKEGFTEKQALELCRTGSGLY